MLAGGVAITGPLTCRMQHQLIFFHSRRLELYGAVWARDSFSAIHSPICPSRTDGWLRAGYMRILMIDGPLLERYVMFVDERAERGHGTAKSMAP